MVAANAHDMNAHDMSSHDMNGQGMARRYARDSQRALVASAASVVTTATTAAVCALPLVAIVLGVGGFGWLTRYAYLRGPASWATLALLLYGFWRVYGCRMTCADPGAAFTRRRAARALLWFCTALALTVNLFEYVVLPRLV